MKVLPTGVQRALAGNKLFVILMIPAALLRIDAELGYRWQSWFNDSWNYVDTAVTLNLDPTRPSGYSLYLWVLKPVPQLRARHGVTAHHGRCWSP